MMGLHNTLEISPYDFAQNEYESPKKSLEEAPEEWNEFWLKSISESGLGKLKAIKKGSYLVDVTTIEISELEIIIKKALEEIDLEEWEDQTGKLIGGIVLKENNKILLEPMCCGDLESTKNWEHIFETEIGKWTQLWIGHPWVYYKRNNGMIEFSDYTESNLEELNDIKTAFSISETNLKFEIQKIRQQQNELEFSISHILEKLKVPNPKQMAKLITGNL